MTYPDPSTAAGQLVMQRAADQRLLNICRTFNEIQNSGNPLTPDEVRRLIDRHPNRYSVLEACATPRKRADG